MATLSHFATVPLQCNVCGPINDESQLRIGFSLYFNKRFLFVFFLHILRHHAQKISHTKGIMLTLYLHVLTFEYFAVKNKFVQIWHVSWHVSESRSRTSPAFTVFVNMALSKTGLRKRQKKGKACFNVGLNFPEKHAMHLKIILRMHHSYSNSYFFNCIN